MTKYIRLFVMTAATCSLLLTACGSSESSSEVKASDFDFDTTTTIAGKNPADVDVCALLTQADANDVAHARALDSQQTDATTYTLTSTKQTGTGIKPTSGCKFTIASSGAQGTVSFQVESASGFSIYSSGTKVEGLGDEAYSSLGTTNVRVGSLMISPGEDSFTQDFTTDLLRKMAPKLK
jgi:hypothetical protein